MVYSNQAQRASDAYEVVATVDADYGDMRFDYDRDIAFCLDGMSEIDFTKKFYFLTYLLDLLFY